MTWEVFAGQLPFSWVHWEHEVEAAVLRGDRPKRPSELPHDALWELMCRCWDSAEAARPDFVQILEMLSMIAQDLRASNDDGEVMDRE